MKMCYIHHREVVQPLFRIFKKKNDSLSSNNISSTCLTPNSPHYYFFAISRNGGENIFHMRNRCWTDNILREKSIVFINLLKKNNFPGFVVVYLIVLLVCVYPFFFFSPNLIFNGHCLWLETIYGI